MKILITGASGFIGANLKEQLVSEYRIVAPTSKELNLLESYQVEKYIKQHKFDAIIHCAIHNINKPSNKDASLLFRNNLLMFANLARCNKFYTRMFYFGSGAEYDVRNYIPKMKESYFDTHVPVDDYGFSKYIMAKYIYNIPNIYDLRLFGIYGKYEDWRIRFISQSICRAICNKDILINKNVYFDYLYIDDLSKIVKIFLEKKQIPRRHYNICTGKTIDLVSLAEIITKISGKKIKVKIIDRGLKKEYSGNNKMLLKTIGKFRFTDNEQAIYELYNWYVNNRSKIDGKLI